MENWKPIPEYEGVYEISNLGRVKSLPRNGTVKHEKIVAQKHTHLGRLEVGLNKRDKKKMFLVHRLVAKVFIENPENKPCVNHIDGNPLNNKVENLEWCTHSENMKHAFRTGLHSLRGDKHNNRKLNSSDVAYIRFLGKLKIAHEDIAFAFGVCRPNITLILNNKIWI